MAIESNLFREEVTGGIGQNDYEQWHDGEGLSPTPLESLLEEKLMGL